MKICIDPGHGGYDPGAVGPTGLKEKDVTLPVAMLLADILRAAGQEVILTRDSDNTPWDSDSDLWKRCQIANDYGADIFVSIHINSATNPAATGTETYCVAFGGEGEKIARSVQKELVAALGLPDRGIKAANFYVLTRTAMPAILTELAFINNSAEEYMMRTDDFLRRAAEAIAQGIGNLYGFAVKGKVPSSNAVTITCGGQTFSGMLIGDITYAPVRAVAEALGKQVGWDGNTRTVTIS
jgi:N-acetylmuramoyl-L-alanine amidase